VPADLLAPSAITPSLRAWRRLQQLFVFGGIVVNLSTFNVVGATGTISTMVTRLFRNSADGRLDRGDRFERIDRDLERVCTITRLMPWGFGAGPILRSSRALAVSTCDRPSHHAGGTTSNSAIFPGPCRKTGRRDRFFLESFTLEAPR